MKIIVNTEKESVQGLRRAIALLEEVLIERAGDRHDVLAELPAREERAQPQAPPSMPAFEIPAKPAAKPPAEKTEKASKPGAGIEIVY